MKLNSVSAAVALALFSTTAMAADLPSRRAPPVYVPPPPVPTFTWTGFYVGAHAGYAFGNSRSLASVGGIPVAAGSASPNGVIGGGHIGYLFSTQGIPFFGNALGTGGVFGVEGDVDGSNYRANYGLGALSTTTRDDIQGSVRGRLGIAVDRALFYATGGAAFGGLTTNYFGPFGTDSFNHTRVGWTVGGGVEYAFTNNWSARVEYRYTDYGTFTDNLAASFPGVNVRRRETDNRVMAGVSYHFNVLNPAPVVARY